MDWLAGIKNLAILCNFSVLVRLSTEYKLIYVLEFPFRHGFQSYL